MIRQFKTVKSGTGSNVQHSMTWLLFLTSWLFCGSSIATEWIIQDKAVYGSDDRYEVHEAGQLLQHVALSVGAIMHSRNVEQTSEGIWTLVPNITGRDKDWCETERFIDQPTAASCTGFLVSPSRLATSAHCVQPANDPGAPGLSCKDMSVVFGYALDEAGEVNNEFAHDRVYRCKNVVAGENNPTGSDWRVIELDRRVAGVDVLTVYRGEQVSLSWQLAIIGHPNGLPAKIGDNAKVVDADSASYFVTDLDSYVGNSGSPVFVEHDGQAVVVGLLSRGADDFEQASIGLDSCQQSRRCTTDSCGGEHVTPANVLREFASRTLGSISVP